MAVLNPPLEEFILSRSEGCPEPRFRGSERARWLFTGLLCLAIGGAVSRAQETAPPPGADVILLVDHSLSMPLGERYYKINEVVGLTAKQRKFPTPDEEFNAYRKARFLKQGWPENLTDDQRKVCAKILQDSMGYTGPFKDEYLDLVVLQLFRDEKFKQMINQVQGFVAAGLPPKPECSLSVIGFRNFDQIQDVGFFDYANKNIGEQKQELVINLAALKALHGGSGIAAALKKGQEVARQRWQSNPGRRQYVLLITDGDDNPVDPGTDKKRENELLANRLGEFKALLQGSDFRVGENVSLWYAHFGEANAELKDSIVSLQGEAKQVQEFSLAGFIFNNNRFEFSGLVAGEKSPALARLPVSGFNLAAGAELAIGQATFSREWKRQDGRSFTAAFQSLQGTTVEFANPSPPVELADLSAADQRWANFFAKIQPSFARNVPLNTNAFELQVPLPDFALPDGDFTARLPVSTKGLIILNQTFIEVSYRVGKPTVALNAIQQFQEGLHNARPGFAKLFFDINPKGFERGNLELRLKSELTAGITLQALVGDERKTLVSKSAVQIPLSSVKGGLPLHAVIAAGMAPNRYPLELEIRYEGEVVGAEKIKGELNSIVVAANFDPGIIAPDQLRISAASAKVPGQSQFALLLDERCLKAAGGKPIKIACRLKQALPSGVSLQLGSDARTLQTLSDTTTTFFEVPVGENTDVALQAPMQLLLQVDNSVKQAAPDLQITLRIASTNPAIKLNKEIAVAASISVGDPPVVNLLPASDINFETLVPDAKVAYRLTLVRNAAAKELTSGLLTVALLAKNEDRQIAWSAGPTAATARPMMFDAATKEWRWTETEVAANRELVLVAEFPPGTNPPPGSREGIVKITSNDPQVQLTPSELPWKLQTAAIVELALTPPRIDWAPPASNGDAVPQSVQFKLADDSPLLPLRFVLKNATQPLAPREASSNAPQIQFFLDRTFQQPINDATVLQIPESRMLELWWQINSKQPEAGTWNYTLHLQSVDPGLLLKRDQFQLTVVTASRGWQVTPPGLITKATRVWPFEYFVRYKTGKPTDAKLYQFEYQLGPNGPVVQGRIEEATVEGEKGLKLSGAEVLPLLPDSFTLSESQPVKSLPVSFHLNLNTAAGFEKDVDHRNWPATLVPNGLQPPRLNVAFQAPQSAPAGMSSSSANGVQVYQVPGTGNVDLDFTSSFKKPTQGGPHEVDVRRIFLQKSAAGQLDDALLRRLRSAARSSETAEDILVLNDANGEEDFKLPTPALADECFQLEVEPPHWFWPTDGNSRELRIVEQITLKDGMEEWQETRLEFLIPSYTPWPFIAVLVLALLLVALAACLAAWLFLASLERKKLAAAMKPWLQGRAGEVILMCETGETFDPPSALGVHIARFDAGRPRFPGLTGLLAGFEFRYAEWATFHEATEDGTPGPAHYLGLAFTRQGLELCSSLPGSCSSQTSQNLGGNLKPGVWLKIDENETPRDFRLLQIELTLPGNMAATPPPPSDDDDELPFDFADTASRTAQFTLEWLPPVIHFPTRKAAKTTQATTATERSDADSNEADLEMDESIRDSYVDLSNEYSLDPEDSFELQDEPSDSSTRLT